MHPRSKHWHLIDYIIVRQEDRGDVRVSKSMCGADCWTDHRLLVSKLNVTVQPQLHPQETKETIQSQPSAGLGDLSVDVSDSGSWHNFSNIVYSVSKEVLGTPNRKHQDWFDDQDADIQSRLHAKNQLFRSHLNDPNSVVKRDGRSSLS